jgi:hypothetical protein
MRRKMSRYGSQKRFPQYGIPIWSLWPNIRFLSSIFAEKNVMKNEHIWVPKTLPTIWHTYMKLVTKYQIPVINICWEKCDKKCAYMLNVYKSQLSRQTGSRSLTGQKTLPTKWGTYMKLVTKYQCWEKCDEKLAYMFNVYKNQQGRQTGSRNLMGTKTLDPRYGVPIWSLWPNIRFVSSIVAEKNVTKNVHILYVQCV